MSVHPAVELLQVLMLLPPGQDAAWLELVGIAGGAPGVPKNEPRAVAVNLSDADWPTAALEVAQSIADDVENVYFGPAPRVRAVGPGHPRSADADVEWLSVLWVDADPEKDALTGLPVDPAWKAHHREAFAHPPLAPSARVDSGHGYHYYWLLAEPLRDVAAGKAMMARMAARVPGGDPHVVNPSRILRLPGWPHVKDPARPLPTALDWCHGHLRYSFAEVVRAFPEKVAAPAKVNGRAMTPRGDVSTPTVGRRLNVAERGVLRDLWVPGSRHALAFALLGAMRKAGWSEADAGAEVDAICSLAGDDEDRRPNVRTTWAKPIGEVAGWSDLKELGVSPSLLPTLDRPMARTGDDGLPAIDVGPDDHRVTSEAIAALAGEEQLYRRGHNLVRVLRDERAHQDPATRIMFPAAAPRISTLPLPSLQELLSANATWWKKLPPKEPGGEWRPVRVRPPDSIVREVAARGAWPALRPLNDVVEVPVLKPDGTVLSVPGYDPMTGLLFEPRGEVLPVPERPTKADAARAVDELCDLVSDFPFTAEVHRAAWLAMTLTPLARYAYGGCTPAMIVSSNKRGSGKGLLADLAAVISVGRELPRSPNPEQPDELRKRITAVAIEGVRIVMIDNVEGVFGSSAFDAVLTSTTWNDRILGESTNTPALPLNTLWVITGNNISLKGDLPRRALMIRLDSELEHPERRDNFRHRALLDHAKERQPVLTRAALTILAAYCAAGRPEVPLSPWGSFLGWSSLVRQAIAWVGLADVGDARAEGDATVEMVETSAQRLLLEAWDEVDKDGKGLTASELLQKLREPTVEMSYPRMKAAVLEFAPTQRGDLPTPRQLGVKFRGIRRAVFDGRFLDMTTIRGESRWRVMQAKPEARTAASA